MPPRPHRPLFAVHGFMYDPADVGGANDPAGFFQEMSGIAGRPVKAFAWYSVPFGLRAERPLRSAWQTARAWMSAWLHGHANPYEYAWALAIRQGGRLKAAIVATQGPVDLVAHSLGVRVALQAMRGLPYGKVKRVIFFNGAELAENAQRVAPEIQADVLNFAIAGDRVLEWLGAYFNGQDDAPCVGRAGLANPPPRWRDLFLDDPTVQRRALARRGWTLRAEAPGGLLNHGESYRFAGNSDLVRAWLSGDGLVDLVADPQPAAKG
jgi:hypothetical protein